MSALTLEVAGLESSFHDTLLLCPTAMGPTAVPGSFAEGERDCMEAV